MDEETRKSDYVPVIYGECNWEGRNTPEGVWRLELGHDVIVTSDSEDGWGHILPRGSVIYLEPGKFQTEVFVGSVATCYPTDYDREGHPVHDLAERRVADAPWRREYPETLPDLPF